MESLIDAINELMWQKIAGFSVVDIAIVVGCIIGALLVDKITQAVIKKAAVHVNEKYPDSNCRYALINAISKPLHLLLLTLGCSLGLFIIEPPLWIAGFIRVLKAIMQCLSLWCFVWYLMRVTDGIAEHIKEHSIKKGNKSDTMIVPLIRGVVKFLFAAIGILVILQNMGYSVSSILAGLGLGGAAIALAAKDTIANFFGSLVVFLDHPFDLGDWVKFSGVEGTVEEIRVRTTLIRSFDGSVIMVPNSVLTSANVNNFQRRQLRRLDANFGVLYSTKAEQIEQIVADIKKYVADHPEILGPKCYIGFSGFGESSLDIFVTVYSTRIAWADFCEVRQQFMLAIMRIVEHAGTSFAFPTRTLEFAQHGEMPVIGK